MPYDVADYLYTDDDRKALFAAAILDGDPGILAMAEEAIERSRKMYPVKPPPPE